LVGTFTQSIDIDMISRYPDSGSKLVQALGGLKFRLLFWIVCKGVEQSLTRIGPRPVEPAASPLICWLVNRAKTATSQRIQVAFGFADALAPNLYRSAEKRVRIDVSSIVGKA
jgi:hypothetical protein